MNPINEASEALTAAIEAERRAVVLPAGLLYFRRNEPVTYQVVARAITTRRTPGVEVELLNPPMAASA